MEDRQRQSLAQIPGSTSSSYSLIVSREHAVLFSPESVLHPIMHRRVARPQRVRHSRRKYVHKHVPTS